MHSSLIKILCIALITATSALTASAQEKKAEKAPAAAVSPKLKGLPFKGTILSVDKVAKTITLNGEKKQVIHIDSQTKLQKDGQPSNFEALTQGLKISGYKQQTATNVWHAKKLNIVTAVVPAVPAVPMTPAPKK